VLIYNKQNAAHEMTNSVPDKQTTYKTSIYKGQKQQYSIHYVVEELLVQQMTMQQQALMTKTVK